MEIEHHSGINIHQLTNKRTLEFQHFIYYQKSIKKTTQADL